MALMSFFVVINMNMRLIFLGLCICFHTFALAAEEKEIEIDSYHFELKNKGKIPPSQTTGMSDKKPELADFASYNDFLNAMYLYKKNQEAVLQPQLIINLPLQQKSTPEYSTVEPNRDISSWGEEITAIPIPDENE